MATGFQVVRRELRPAPDHVRSAKRHERRLIDIAKGRMPTANDEIQLVDEKTVAACAREVNERHNRANAPGRPLLSSAHWIDCLGRHDAVN